MSLWNLTYFSLKSSVAIASVVYSEECFNMCKLVNSKTLLYFSFDDLISSILIQVMTKLCVKELTSNNFAQ